MYALFSTFISSYDSTKIIEIDHDLTDLHSDINCCILCTTAKVQSFILFFLFYEMLCTNKINQLINQSIHLSRNETDTGPDGHQGRMQPPLTVARKKNQSNK